MSLLDDVRENIYLRAVPPHLRGYTEDELRALSARTYVKGGGSDDTRAFGSKAKSRKTSRLDEFEAVYEGGGPIAELVDIRANMIFGTGTEFVSDTNPGLADWCDKTFRWRDKFFVDVATDCYVYGDAFSEHKTTRSGAYSREILVQPQTVDKAWDRHGETSRWIQSFEDTAAAASSKPITLPPDALAHYRLLGHPRKPWGVSLIGRSWDEINRYADNQAAISNSLRLHGYPRYHIKVGREGGQSIPDRILRLVRNRFNTRNWDEKTNWVTGADINIEPIAAADIKFEGITEHDLALLALAFGLPIEIANVGSDGLGTGFPAKARLQAFERKGRGQQTRLAEDFIEQVVKPTIRKFSPYSSTEHIDLVWGDIVADEEAISAWLAQFKEYYTVDEVREKFGDAPHDGDDDELGPPGGADPMGGMFGGFGGPEPPTPGGGVDGGDDAGGDSQDPPSPSGDTEGTQETPGSFDLAAAYGFETQPRGQDGKLMSWAEACGCSSGGRTLSLYDSDGRDALWKEELVFLEMYEGGIWHEDTGRNLLQFSGGSLPDGVRDRLLEAVDGGAIFGSIDSVPPGARTAVVEAFRDAINADKWTVSGIMDALKDQALGLTDGQAEAIARTEMASVVNQARELYYEEREEERGESFLYEWTGPQDRRTTDACEEAKRRTKGGVTMDELKEIIADVSREYFPDLSLREFVIHPFERHTYARVVS